MPTKPLSQHALLEEEAQELQHLTDIDAERLDKAVELVAAGAVTIGAAGFAIVVSDGKPYLVSLTDGTCNCPDAVKRAKTDTRPCKHRAAVLLCQRVKDRLAGLDPAPADVPTPTVTTTHVPTPAPPFDTWGTWASQHPPATCTVQFSVDGISYTYCIRDSSDEAVLARIRGLEEKVAKARQARKPPLPPAGAPPVDAAPPTPPPASVDSSPVTADSPATADCPLHHEVMSKRGPRQGEYWYSHKHAASPGGYCNGKPKKAA